MKKTIKIGLIGYGTVGQGVYKIIKNNKKAIEQRIGASIDIAGICDVRPVKVKNCFCTTKYQALISKPEIDIIIELIGGYDPARTIILDSLKAGKHVVTANKAVLSKYWDEVFSCARQYNKLLYFEASVAGGVPAVQALNEGLAANRIEKILGILNGTTNYILTEMTKQKISFADALKQAQKAGFAEANPYFDVEGIDTAHKLAILSSLALSSWVKLGDIPVEGINNISQEDIFHAKQEFGYIMKLIGSAKMADNSLEISVAPCLVSSEHPFANVDQEYNAVLIHGDAVGDVMFYGKGAGQLPAASAVVSDIIFLARQIASGTAGKVPYVSYDPATKVKIVPQAKSTGCYYLKFTTIDKPGVLAKISGVLGKYNISIASLYQKEPLTKVSSGVPIIMLTHNVSYGNLIKALNAIDKMPIVKAKTVKFKIED